MGNAFALPHRHYCPLMDANSYLLFSSTTQSSDGALYIPPRLCGLRQHDNMLGNATGASLRSPALMLPFWHCESSRKASTTVGRNIPTSNCVMRFTRIGLPAHVDSWVAFLCVSRDIVRWIRCRSFTAHVAVPKSSCHCRSAS